MPTLLRFDSHFPGSLGLHTLRRLRPNSPLHWFSHGHRSSPRPRRKPTAQSLALPSRARRGWIGEVQAGTERGSTHVLRGYKGSNRAVKWRNSLGADV